MVTTENNTTNLNEENKNLKDYAEVINKRIDTIVKDFTFDLDRIIAKTKREFGFKIEEKKDNLMEE